MERGLLQTEIMTSVKVNTELYCKKHKKCLKMLKWNFFYYTHFLKIFCVCKGLFISLLTLLSEQSSNA